jgi:hypothetical protein
VLEFGGEVVMRCASQQFLSLVFERKPVGDLDIPVHWHEVPSDGADPWRQRQEFDARQAGTDFRAVLRVR